MAWSIDNGATIDNNGLVTFPINNGTTDVFYTITFTDGDCSCTKTVKVKPNPTPCNISISASTETLTCEGGTVTFKVV